MFNIYTVHLKCFDSIRYNLNQYKTLTKNFNQTRTYIHTYIHTDTVKAICPHGDYRPRGHKNWKYWKVPLQLLVKWLLQIVVDRGQWESISNISSIPLFWFFISNVGGGGGRYFFLHFMLFPTFLENKNSGNKKNMFFFRKTILFHLMFFSLFFLC